MKLQKVHKRRLEQILKIVFVMLVVLSINLGMQAHEADKESTASMSVADIDPDNIKKNAMKENKAGGMTTLAQSEPLAGDLSFIYSKKGSGSSILLLYNKDTLAIHSYISDLGYLMEYLGVNGRDASYYDVRLQGDVYAIKKADAMRFIPLSQIKSFPYYENKDGIIVHHVEGDPLVNDSWYLTTTLGTAPSWMQAGKKYYSFNGIYFTDTPDKLGQYDARTNAINAQDPYYDYYLYQPARTKTSLSAEQLNTAFNTLVKNKQTKMTNTGANFIAAQNKYGVNALLMFAMGIHESAYGQSKFAVDRNNLFGVDAVDSNPGAAASFPSIVEGIQEQGNYLSWVYADAEYESGVNYYGSNLGTKSSGMNVKYASDPYWGEKIANHYARIDRMVGAPDYQKYNLAITRQGADIYWDSTGNSKAHTYKKSTSSLAHMYPVVYYNDGKMTEIALEPAYDKNKSTRQARYPDGGQYYWYHGYVDSSDIIKVSKSNQSEGNQSGSSTDNNEENGSQGQGTNPGSTPQPDNGQTGQETNPGSTPQPDNGQAGQEMNPGSTPQPDNGQTGQETNPGSTPQPDNGQAGQGTNPGSTPQPDNGQAGQGTNPGSTPQPDNGQAGQGTNPGIAQEANDPTTSRPETEVESSTNVSTATIANNAVTNKAKQEHNLVKTGNNTGERVLFSVVLITATIVLGAIIYLRSQLIYDEIE